MLEVGTSLIHPSLPSRIHVRHDFYGVVEEGQIKPKAGPGQASFQVRVVKRSMVCLPKTVIMLIPSTETPHARYFGPLAQGLESRMALVSCRAQVSR